MMLASTIVPVFNRCLEGGLHGNGMAASGPRRRCYRPSYIDERYYEEMFARRVRQFGEWTLDRPNTTLIVTTDAGHAMFRDDPDLAMEAVRRVVVRVGAGR